ncbi:hypothetical protein [Kurthia sibirica]|uniref:Uncharacterized protein n=1 Tax=Kurthia sibirica TaxID=202750 RepID=A0A2U3ANB6_9BACL|nr:hypothetical protein [Kurthia sibirica]PWI26006.1 hypothetical protein DEX24_05600 [Kurthia sibirica]GEK35275.1 hypothetical protein KSI01_28080 [Kurthia sibirica]
MTKRPIVKKIMPNSKRWIYTIRLFLGYGIAAAILVILTNIVLKLKGFPDGNWFAADEGTWLTFYGALIGGFITLLGVNQTIRFTQQEDQRMQQAEALEEQKEYDLTLIQHLWQLETSYHHLAKEFQIMHAKIKRITATERDEIQRLINTMQEDLLQHDFVSISSKINWDTYHKVMGRMKRIRNYFIDIETQLLSSNEAATTMAIKEDLLTMLSKEIVEIDLADADFESQRVALEEKHLNTN